MANTGQQQCPACHQFLPKSRNSHPCPAAKPPTASRKVDAHHAAAKEQPPEPTTGTQASLADIDAHYAAFLASAKPEVAPVGDNNAQAPNSAANSTVMDRLAAGQAPLLMSAQEILDNFAPAEGDRLYWYADGRGSPDHDETDDEYWARKRREAQGEPRRHKFPPWPKPGDDTIPPAPSRESPGFLHPEDQSPYPNARHGSLFDALSENGVTSPISLQGQPGQDGRRQVLGGNHRVAAMADIDPDAPLPVAFFASVNDAHDSLGDSF